MKGKNCGKEEQAKCSFLGLLLWLGCKGLGRAYFTPWEIAIEENICFEKYVFENVHFFTRSVK